MENNYKAFPKKLKQLMEKKRINAVILSEKTGIGNATISDWLSEKYFPSFISVCKLADYFNVSVNYFAKED